MSKASTKMRVYHRYLGFFLAGIMAIYSISGIILIFRNTDFLKKEIQKETIVESNLNEEALGKAIKVKELKFLKKEGDLAYFKQGQYQSPFVLSQYILWSVADVFCSIYFLDVCTGHANF